MYGYVYVCMEILLPLAVELDFVLTSNPYGDLLYYTWTWVLNCINMLLLMPRSRGLCAACCVEISPKIYLQTAENCLKIGFWHYFWQLSSSVMLSVTDFLHAALVLKISLCICMHWFDFIAWIDLILLLSGPYKCNTTTIQLQYENFFMYCSCTALVRTAAIQQHFLCYCSCIAVVQTTSGLSS